MTTTAIWRNEDLQPAIRAIEGWRGSEFYFCVCNQPRWLMRGPKKEGQLTEELLQALSGLWATLSEQKDLRSAKIMCEGLEQALVLDGDSSIFSSETRNVLQDLFFYANDTCKEVFKGRDEISIHIGELDDREAQDMGFTEKVSVRLKDGTVEPDWRSPSSGELYFYDDDEMDSVLTPENGSWETVTFVNRFYHQRRKGVRFIKFAGNTAHPCGGG